MNLLSAPSSCLRAGSVGAVTGVRWTVWLFQTPFVVKPVPGGPPGTVLDVVVVEVGPVW